MNADVRRGQAFGILLTKLEYFANGVPEIMIWINAEKDDFGSFIWCCEEIELDPDRARAVLNTRDPRDLKKLINDFRDQVEEVSAE